MYSLTVSLALLFASAPAADSKPLVEACDGSRTTSTEPVAAMSCARWKIEFQSSGKVWGVVTADSLEDVVALRDRHVGFARQYARFFGQAMDDRYKDTSAPICDGCKPSATSGRWGTGQKFSGAASKQAAADAQTKIDALAEALVEHMPHLTDAARLAQETKTARAAKRYAAQPQARRGRGRQRPARG